MFGIIPPFAGFTGINGTVPQLYWNSYSAEQRIKAICMELKRAIDYAESIGMEVNEVSEAVQDIYDGKIDDIIIATINEWFEENQPELLNRLSELENEVETLQTDVSELQAKQISLPNFRCIDRFIFGKIGTDNVNSAQAGCLFVQDSLTYWAQIMNSLTQDSDHLIIRCLDNGTQVADLTAQLGHGYTLSYNPTTKQLLTNDAESGTSALIFIDVSAISNPRITQISTLPGINNACWYDDTHIIGSIGNQVWNVYDVSNFTLTDSYRFISEYSHGNGYIFQNICWYPADNKAYIGTTSPDGIIICDIDDEAKTFTMSDFIATEQYYGCLYMRELQFAYRLGNSLYINQYDTIDGLMVVSLLEWNMYNGTIPNENSKALASTSIGNYEFHIDWENGNLIQNSSSGNAYKLAGDAINELASLQGNAYGRLIFDNDYPNVVEGRGSRLHITASKAVTVKGFNLFFCDVIWNPSYVISVTPSIAITSGGATHYIGFRCSTCDMVKFIANNSYFPVLSNPDNVTNAHRIYIENSTMQSLHSGVFTANDWLRWSALEVNSSTSIANATKQACTATYSS